MTLEKAGPSKSKVVADDEWSVESDEKIQIEEENAPTRMAEGQREKRMRRIYEFPSSVNELKNRQDICILISMLIIFILLILWLIIGIIILTTYQNYYIGGVALIIGAIIFIGFFIFFILSIM